MDGLWFALDPASVFTTTVMTTGVRGDREFILHNSILFPPARHRAARVHASTP
jgi:hypothetical protein